VIATPNTAADDNIAMNCPPAEWNYYGGNACGFVGDDAPHIEWPEKFSKPDDTAAVTGYTDSAGDDIGSDSWIGLPLRMNAGLTEAKLVDVDPVCPWSSQIFVDTLSVGDAASQIGFVARSAGRAHARWLNFSRNLDPQKLMIAGRASCVFQLVLPRPYIQFFNKRPAAGSLDEQLLRALEQPQVQGLMVRFVAYLTIYFQGDAFKDVVIDPKQPPQFSYFPVMAQLYAEYAERRAAYERGELGGPPPLPVNRAYSRTVGWIAPWTKDELRSMPGGRVLLGAKPFGPAAIEYATDAEAPERVARLSIDLGSTMPETDPQGTKKDYGTMHVALRPLSATGAPRDIALVPYEHYAREAYEKRSGVVDIPASAFLAPLTAADVQSNLFCIYFPAASGEEIKPLVESPFVAQTDDRGVYVNEPGAPWTSDPAHDLHTVRVQVRYLGAAPPSGTSLGVVQYTPDPPNFAEIRLRIVNASPSMNNQSPYLELQGPASSRGEGFVVLPVPPPDGSDPYSIVNVCVRGVRSGCPVLGFYPIAPRENWNAPPIVKFADIGQLFYSVLRVLPFHNDLAQAFEDWLDTGPTIDLVTQRVFEDVFRTYYLMYPAMRFLRDALQFQAWRGRVLEISDPSRFDSAAYMPVTRSLSAGQRRILELWGRYADGTYPTPVRRLARLARRA
jgi:hypothetical protein